MAVNQSRNIRVGLQGLPPPSQAEVDVLTWLETNALCGPCDEALYLRSPGGWPARAQGRKEGGQSGELQPGCGGLSSGDSLARYTSCSIL